MNDRNPHEGIISKTPTITERLSFNECNIVIENITRCRDKSFFLTRLRALRVNTEDPGLQQDILSLYEKIQSLSEEGYQQMRQDAERSAVLFPPNYSLPNGG